MKYLLVFSVLLASCSSLKPKSIGLEIELAKAPSFKEAKSWKSSKKWKKVDGKTWVSDDHHVLINGQPVDKNKYPHVVRIVSASGAGCTASIVGPDAIVTAAHCADTGEKVTFTGVDGVKYTATMYHYESWPSKDLDLSIGKLDKKTAIKPVSLRTDRFEKQGMLVDLMGYGCINPGGGGGNDGVLRAGSAKITGAQGYDLVLDASPSALCYGDSGGPVFFEGKQVGVNSKGNIRDKSYTTRTTLDESKSWLTATATKLGVTICGVSTTDQKICGGPNEPENPNPPVPPAPKQFTFENGTVTIQGVCK